LIVQASAQAMPRPRAAASSIVTKSPIRNACTHAATRCRASTIKLPSLPGRRRYRPRGGREVAGFATRTITAARSAGDWSKTAVTFSKSGMPGSDTHGR
jgi:hypothetical protein